MIHCYLAYEALLTSKYNLRTWGLYYLVKGREIKTGQYHYAASSLDSGRIPTTCTFLGTPLEETFHKTVT